MDRKSLIQAHYDAISVSREDYIMSLWTSHHDLERWNEWLAIYNNLKFPWEKPHAFHLYDNHKLLQQTPERTLAVLDNNPVKNTLEYFIEHTEDCMRKLKEEDNQWSFNRDHLNNITDEEHLNNATYEADSLDQENREYATAHKRDFFEKLLSFLQTRKAQDYYWRPLWFSEDSYIKLEKVSWSNDSKKRDILRSILLLLPNQSRDFFHKSDDILDCIKI